MGHDQNLQQRWEFRRRESYSDSSSDEPQSSSSSEPVRKKHKPISLWTIPETAEVGSFTRLQQQGKSVPGSLSHSKGDKTNKKVLKLSKKEDDPVHKEVKPRPSRKEAKKKKNKGSNVRKPASMEDTRIFMESILEELKVARDNMIVRMREEMQKIMDSDNKPSPTERESNYKEEVVEAPHHNSFKSDLDVRTPRPKEGESHYKQEIVEAQHRNSFKSELDVRTSTTRSFAGSVKRKRTKVSRDCNELLKIPITSTEEGKGERLREFVKEPTFSLCPEQVVSPMYLTLPTVLPEARVKNRRFESPSSNYFQAQLAGNLKGVNAGKASLMHDSSICHTQAHVGSESYIGQNKFTPASNAETGLPFSFHHDLDGALKIQSQVNLGNLSRLQNNISDLGMNRSLRSARGSSGFSEFYNAIGIHNHLNSKADGVTSWTHGNSIPRA